MIEQIKISSTLRALLRWSKKEDIDMTPESINLTLTPIYGVKMEIKDMIIVFFEAYVEALNEPRFEINKDWSRAFIDVINYPCFNLHKARNGQEALGTYQKDILSYITGQFRCARVDWCHDYVFTQEDVS